jgi:hypothetical protein
MHTQEAWLCPSTVVADGMDDDSNTKRNLMIITAGYEQPLCFPIKKKWLWLIWNYIMSAFALLGFESFIFQNTTQTGKM